ncbi:MAG: hypothetical protein ACMG6S_08705, partial [Byssovorax sp.]
RERERERELPCKVGFAPKTIDGCPGERAFRAEVASWVGYDPFSPEGADLITIWFERAGPIFSSSFTLTTSDQTSGIHREFEATCTGLFRTMGIGVGLAISPSDGPPPLLPAPPPEPPPDCPSPPEPAAPPPIAPPVPSPVASPPPPKRSFRLVAGLDGIFTPFIAPSAVAGISVWAGVDLLKLPLAFELDFRSSWSVAHAKVTLPYDPVIALRTTYLSAVVAGCWHRSFYLCPVLEVGRMSFSRVDAHAKLTGLPSSLVVAAGGRAAYAHTFAEHFVLRGLVEVEALIRSASIKDQSPQPLFSSSPVSLTVGLGFGGYLW